LSFRRRRYSTTAQTAAPATAAPINAQAHAGRPPDSSEGAFFAAAAAPAAAAAAGAWLVDVVVVAVGVVAVWVWMTVLVCVGVITVVVGEGVVTVLVWVTVFVGGGAVAVLVVVGDAAAVVAFGVVVVVACCCEGWVSPLACVAVVEALPAVLAVLLLARLVAALLKLVATLVAPAPHPVTATNSRLNEIAIRPRPMRLETRGRRLPGCWWVTVVMRVTSGDDVHLMAGVVQAPAAVLGGDDDVLDANPAAARWIVGFQCRHWARTLTWSRALVIRAGARSCCGQLRDRRAAGWAR